MLVKEKYGLAEIDFFSIAETLYQNKKIEQAVLFGSRTMGSFHEGSNVDIALKGKNLCLEDILNLSIALDELFLPYKFDLILYDRIKENALLKHIDHNGVLLKKRVGSLKYQP